MKNLYTVGEFSDLFGLNVQTLRYYDSIKLFQPACRDAQNGRRFYEFSQVYALAGIRFHRQLGYSLNEMKEEFPKMHRHSSLGALEKHADTLKQKCIEIERLEKAVRRKILYTQTELAQYEKTENTQAAFVRYFPKRYYLSIGEENRLYYDESFYLYPTVVFYEKGLKRFGAYICHENDEIPKNEDTELKSIEAGYYLCGYHKGGYTTVLETAKRIRDEYTHLTVDERSIHFNIVDQFLETDGSEYITAVQFFLPDGK